MNRHNRRHCLWMAWLLACWGTPAYAFDQNSVSNLVFWLKADAGVTTNVNGTVLAWNDQSASGNNASLLTGNPTWIGNIINGKPAVWFDGGADTLSFTRISNIRTVFWVLNEYSAASDNYRPLLGDSANYDFHRGGSKIFWDSNASPSVRGGTTYTNGVSVGTGLGTRPPITISIVALVTTGNVRSDQLGRDRWVDDRAWHGYIAEVLVYSHALSSNQQKTVGSYLAGKYGLTTTYASTPPIFVNNTSGASHVTATSVRLNGTLTSTGDAPTRVHVFWGTQNGGTNPASWGRTNALGIRPTGPFSTNLTGLISDTTYYYACRATNVSSRAWTATRWFRSAMAAEPGYKRMKIRFKGYTRSEPLAYFPLLVTFSNGITGFRYQDFMSPPQNDLRFTDTNLASLHYEIERWDTTGVSHVWVQVPRLVNTNAFIYAYWCRPGLQAPTFTTNGMTWSEGFGGVWHCKETVTHNGKQLDSTANRNDATFNDANASSAAGTAGGAAGYATRLSGDADYLVVPHASSIQPRGSMTCEIWARSGTANWNEDGMLLSKRDAYLLHPSKDIKNFIFYCWNPSISSIGYTPTADLTAWHYYAGTYDATAMRVFMDGRRVGATGGGGNLFEDTGPLFFGRDDGLARYLNGWVDEIRISTVARSTNWIWATWMNVASNSTFIAYGPIENRIQPGSIFMMQ